MKIGIARGFLSTTILVCYLHMAVYTTYSCFAAETNGCTGISQKSGVDLVGNDMRAVQNVDSLDKCCSHCAQEMFCEAFTYKSNTCWLKHTAGSGSQCSTCTAGFKTNRHYGSGTINQDIPDFDLNLNQNGILESSINISDAQVLNDVEVTVTIIHPWDSDLSISLVHPSGRSVLLFYRMGNGGNLKITNFDQQASLLIANGTAPFTGSYQPVESLSSLNGEKGDGMWKLIIADHIPWDRGVLKDWILSLTYTF